MKYMKKNLSIYLSILLAVMLLVPGAAYAAKDENVVKLGVLEMGDMDGLHTGEHDEHMRKENAAEDRKTEMVHYDNLTSALMDLESGKIVAIVLEKCAADYAAARNEKVGVVINSVRMTDYSMMTLEENKEAFDILNNAIVEMKADGTLDSLIENELKAYIESDPEPKDLPEFEGAKTIKIGVTGDLPPMDYVAANGKAAGFNVALLAEIANRAQVNIELVQIETGARPMALASGKVDAVFWTKGITCTTCGAADAEKVEGTIVTESYFTDYAASLSLKSDK